MDLQNIARMLIILGVVILATGMIMYFAPKVPFLGKLPGDFYFKKGGTSFYFPLATSIILSIVVTVIFNLFSNGK